MSSVETAREGGKGTVSGPWNLHNGGLKLKIQLRTFVILAFDPLAV